MQAVGVAAIGSSPRGRGTPSGGPGRSLCSRFIPARAGNTRIHSQYDSTPPVHPRAGGEHPHVIHRLIHTLGSSPRGRGTQPSPRDQPVGCRFIPARAGNTRHPSLPSFVKYGSSPRGRGTQTPPAAHSECQRFIPARAGNTGSPLPRDRRSPVHPRAGGEHTTASGDAEAQVGSSPRGRGTPEDSALDFERERFIPARAGNTRA